MSTLKDLVIGVDCSTTASKAVVWDLCGSPLAEGRCALPLIMPRPAWHEQQADLWWTATTQALREAVAQVDPRRLAALCMTHQRETFVPVDEAGHPLRNAIVWMDERCRSLLPELERMWGGAHIHQLTGKPLSGNLSLGKILWLKRNEPEGFERVFKFLDVHAFLVYRMTGHFRTGWGCADPMGLFDTRQHCWAGELVQAVGLRLDQLPEAYPPGEILGEVTQEAAIACGLPVGLPVVTGLGDGQCAGLGANITRDRLAYLSLGTSVVSGTCSESYVTDRAFRTMTSGLPGVFLLETVLLAGTYIVNWFLDSFGSGAADWSNDQALEAAIQNVPPGALGLVLVPYWNSAMNPYWDATASGIVVGWRGFHDRTHLYRSILEGIAFEQRLHTSGVEAATGQDIECFIATGGGARNSAWLQIIADITSKPVFRSVTLETAALGAGILAASAVGLYPNVRDAATAMTHVEQTPIEPDARRSALYNRLYEQVYRHLFPALQPYLSRLTELSEGTQS
jgi:sugar (pentulose or hexulose) kinase